MNSQQQQPQRVHRTVTSPSSTSATASPKKKPARHVVTRQIFALPVLQTFEPVLATSPRSYMVPTGSIPKIDAPNSQRTSSNHSPATPVGMCRPSSNRPGSGGAGRCPSSSGTRMRPTSPATATTTPTSPATTASAPLPQRPRDRASSPRVLRPQPPPPVGISARGDVDIYRYSQGVTQRMAIRPILEQKRREDEAAQQAREAQSRTEQPVEYNSDANDDPEQLEAYARGRSQETQRPSTSASGSSDGDSDNGSHPTLPVAAALCAAESDASDKQAIDTDSQPHSDKDEALVDAFVSDTPDTSDSTAALVQADATISAAAVALQIVQPLVSGHYHDPFRVVQPTDVMASLLALSPPSPTKQLERTLDSPVRVVHKVLWKDRRTLRDANDNDNTDDALLTLLLSSEATAHVTIDVLRPFSNPSGTADAVATTTTTTIPITDADMAASTIMRPDLRVLSPTWAEWMLSHVRCDSFGACFLALNDDNDDNNVSCFDDPCVVLDDGRQQSVTLRVIHGSKLLISVCDVESNTTTTELLSQTEVVELIQQFRGIESDTNNDIDAAAALGDAAFLAFVAMTSPVQRLGRLNNQQRTQQAPPHEPFTQASDATDANDTAQPLVQSLPLRCDGLAPDGIALLLHNSTLATVAFLAHAITQDALQFVLRRFQQSEAVALHAQHYVIDHAAALTDATSAFRDHIVVTIEQAKDATLQTIAIASIVDDWITALITYECRVALTEAQASGAYDDLFATKVQATFRMAMQRRQFMHHQAIRMRAAAMLQALQRGVAARRRYSERKRERERFLFYSVRTKLRGTTAAVEASAICLEDPKQRAQELADETERQRQRFLLQVFDGYAIEHGLAMPYALQTTLIETLCSQFGVVVGCPATFGAIVAAVLSASAIDCNSNTLEETMHARSAIHAALVVALRSLGDDTFGLSVATRRLDAIDATDRYHRRRLLYNTEAAASDTDAQPPRWLLKISAPYQRANRTRLAALRVARRAAARRARHLVASAYRHALASDPLAQFAHCRAAWEAAICSRRTEQRWNETNSLDAIAERALDLVIASIKDWGIDAELLFAGLNVCVQHRQRKLLIARVEAQFDAFAQGVNELHGKRNILRLRDEIEHELEAGERLLALRTLHMGRCDASDDVNDASSSNTTTLPPSELLQLVLAATANDNDAFVRFALPVVLPVARVTDKYALALYIIQAYANATTDGAALLTICWSCLDAADNVTVEAAQFVDRMLQEDAALGRNKRELHACADAAESTSTSTSSSSVASRALYLLTDTAAVQLLQFMAKVAHFNATIQRHVVSLLAPLASHATLYRLASVVAAVDDLRVVSKLFDAAFGASEVYACEPLWTIYDKLYGTEATASARSRHAT